MMKRNEWMVKIIYRMCLYMDREGKVCVSCISVGLFSWPTFSWYTFIVQCVHHVSQALLQEFSCWAFICRTHYASFFFKGKEYSAATNIMFSNANVVVCVYICETYDHTIKTKKEERQSHVRFWWFDISACLYEKWKRNSTFFLLDSRLGFRVQNYIHINNFWFLSPKDSPGAIIKTPLTLNQVVSTCFPFSYNFGVHGGCHIRK